MPGLDRFKTLLRKKGKNTQRNDSQATASTSDDMTSPNASVASPASTPSKAPRLEGPNASAGLNQSDGTREHSDQDDMTAAVLSAGKNAGSTSNTYQGNSSQPLKENAPPAKNTATARSEAPQTPTRNPFDTSLRDQPPPGAQIASHDTPKEETSTSEPTSAAVEKSVERDTDGQDNGYDNKLVQESQRAKTDAAVDTSRPNVTGEETSELVHGSAQPDVATKSNGSGDAIDDLNESPADNVASTRTNGAVQESTSNEGDEMIEPPGKPTESEIEDIEKKEAQAAVEASKGPGTASVAEVDQATSKETGDVIKTVAANAGAAGPSMGMSATSGPMMDMPAH